MRRPLAVTVVVDYQVEERIEIGCATSFDTGLQALESAGFDYTATNGFVVSVGGVAAPPSGYWSYYFSGSGTDAYTFFSVGAATSQPDPGSIEAWTIEPDYTDEVSPQPG